MAKAIQDSIIISPDMSSYNVFVYCSLEKLYDVPSDFQFKTNNEKNILQFTFKSKIVYYYQYINKNRYLYTQINSKINQIISWHTRRHDGDTNS
jgi:hypothetical protein